MVGPVDGGWSTWSEWSACSVTCDTGTQTRHRTCTEPTPRDGGSDCSGDDTQTQSCDLGSCTGPPGLYCSFGFAQSFRKPTFFRRKVLSFRDIPRMQYLKVWVVRLGSYIHTIDITHPLLFSVDGDWGSCGSWSFCPVTCGTGLQYRV